MGAQIRSISHIIILTAGLLFMFFTATLFTDEVAWSIGDFIMAGLLLLSFGFGYKLLISRLKNTKYRTILAILLAVLIIFVWAELAVGIIGSSIGGS